MSKAVILLAYGTPRSLDDVEAYYTHIRGGRRPSAEQLADLVGRYKRIGGASPLIRITEAQRGGLERALSSLSSQTRVYAAMKHSPPFIADVVVEAVDEGADEILGVALAPHYAKMSIGSYQRALEEGKSRATQSIRLQMVQSWHDNPKLVEAWADRVTRAGRRFEDGYSLVFSAHSLPERILAEGDPYKDQLLSTSDLVAGKAGKEEWTLSFQSASQTGEPWLGPDILQHLQTLYEGGAREFVSAPIGFVADHLEVLHDIDVECREWAASKGARLERCESLNATPEFIDCLVSIVQSRGFA